MRAFGAGQARRLPYVSADPETAAGCLGRVAGCRKEGADFNFLENGIDILD